MINPEFGYYLCGGIKFERKIEALIHSSIHHKPVHWYFQDEIYSKYPWQIEPTESLDDLYDRRARELREKYDYLILSFSGGADSFNVLQSFIRQNLHIDEIVTIHTGYVTKTHANLDVRDTNNQNLCAEHELNAIPKLKYASEKLPNTKITILDDTDYVFKAMKEYEDEDWILKRNDHLGAVAPLRFNLFQSRELRLTFDKQKSIAIIYGRDKPKIKISSDEVYTTFSDIAVNTIKTTTHNTDYTNIKSEYFYWNSSCLDMLCKQAHTVKRFIENNPSFLPVWGYARNDRHRVEQEDLLKTIIYTTWNRNWFQVQKNTKQWDSEQMQWFRKDPKFSTETMLWKRGLDYAHSLLKDTNYLHYVDGNPDSLQPFIKRYYIGKLNVQ